MFPGKGPIEKPITSLELMIVTSLLENNWGIKGGDDDFIGAASQIMAIGRRFTDNNIDKKSKHVR
jgi:hypothetical protein